MAEEKNEQQAEETPQVESTESQSQAEAPAEEAPGFKMDVFNKTFNTSYEDEGSLKKALEGASNLHEIQLNLQQAQEKSKKYDEFLEYYKPENLYGDDETYAFIELKKKFPDRDLGVVSKIRSSDFESMSDIDKLVLADKLRVKSNVSDTVRRSGILQKLGIETDDLSEWTDADHYKVATALSDRMIDLNEIRHYKPDPKVFDLAREKEQYEKSRADRRKSLSEKIKPFAESLINNYKGPKAYNKDDKGEFNEIFNYNVDADSKSQFIDSLVQVMTDADMEPTKENLQQAMNYVDNHFKVLNFDKIVAAAIKHGQSMADEKAHNEIHSDQPVNTQEAPKAVETQGLTLKERMRKNWDKKD